MKSQFALACGALLAAAAVLLGAFGAHGLEPLFERRGERVRNAWHTASEYQMSAAILLMISGWVIDRGRCRGGSVAAWMLLAGVACFSGSLYLWVLTEIRQFNFVTPVGGLLLAGGMITLSLTCLCLPDRSDQSTT